MYTKEQVIRGVIAYIDNEVIPSLPTHLKWLVGTYVLSMSLDTKKIDEILHQPMLSPLNIEKNGMYDIDNILDNLKESAVKYGKAEMTFPVVGTLYFSDQDVQKLHDFIRRA